MNTLRLSDRSIRSVGSVGSFLVLFAATAAFGAAAPANFEQEWSKLIAAAKQEGNLLVASGGAPSRQYRPVMEDRKSVV